MRTQGRDGSQQAKEKPPLDLGPPASKTVRKQNMLFKPSSLWYMSTAVQADSCTWLQFPHLFLLIPQN